MFPVLQIRRPVLAAVCFALGFAAQIAVFGAVRGAPPADILFEATVGLIVGSVAGAAMNRWMRPEGLAELSPAQLRSVFRWVRRGEVIGDRAVAASVIVYARHQERNEPWASACFAMLTVSAMIFTVAGPVGVDSVLVAGAVLVAGIVFLVDQRAARRRRRAAVVSARRLLGQL